VAPKLVTGEQLGAFAAHGEGSRFRRRQPCRCKRARARTLAFIFECENAYITNAAIAHVLDVMARTPVPGSDKTAITASCHPRYAGVHHPGGAHAEMGIRGTAMTGTFRAVAIVKVPKENILGRPGKGLKVALTVLDLVRTTFGALLHGAAAKLAAAAVEHAQAPRKQIPTKRLGEFHLVKKENRCASRQMPTR